MSASEPCAAMSANATWRTPRVIVVGVALWLVAMAVRGSLLTTARFGGDEALFFQLGMDIVEGKAFPLLGTPITDGAARLPGPAFLYLMAAPLFFWPAPEAQYLFTEALGACTVVVWWLTARRIVGDWAAALSGGWLACAPWAALFADRTWNPNVLPFFVVVAMASAWRVREAPGSRAALVLWPSCALLPQLHLSAPVAWVGLLVLVGSRSLRAATTSSCRRHHLLGLVVAGLLFVPLAVHEAQTEFANIHHLLDETVGRQGGERHPWGFVWVPVYALRLLTTDVSYHELSGYWGGPDEWRCLHSLWFGTEARPHHPLRILGLIASLVVGVGAFFGTVVAARRDPRARIVSIAVASAIVANAALMALSAKQVFGHYVIVLLPFVFLLVATSLRHAQGRWRSILIVCVVVSSLVGVEATMSVSRHVDARIGLRVHRRAVDAIDDDARARGINEDEPVALSYVGIYGSRFDWQVFVTRAAKAPWRLDPRARVRRFAVTPLGAPAPKHAVGPSIDLEHALLWRLR
jgi:hypothetical protein